MGDGKEGNHKLSPPFYSDCIGETCILIIVLCRNSYSEQRLTLPLHIKNTSVIDIILKVQEEQDENDHSKAYFAGLITIG
jgi:hypothetical protein